MVQKQAALRGVTGDEVFAEDDPLAELARIVGYDAPSIQKPAEPERHEPAFDLEDELLREFETYDAPTPAPQVVADDAQFHGQPQAEPVPYAQEHFAPEPSFEDPAPAYSYDEREQAYSPENFADAFADEQRQSPEYVEQEAVTAEAPATFDEAVVEPEPEGEPQAYPDHIDLPEASQVEAFDFHPESGQDDAAAPVENVTPTDLIDELELAIADFPQFAEETLPEPQFEQAESLAYAPQPEEPVVVDEPPYAAPDAFPAVGSNAEQEDVPTAAPAGDMFEAPPPPRRFMTLPVTNYTLGRSNLSTDPRNNERPVTPAPQAAAPVAEPEPDFSFEPQLTAEELFPEEDRAARASQATDDVLGWAVPEEPQVEAAPRAAEPQAVAPEVFADQNAQNFSFVEQLAATETAPVSAERAELPAEDEFDPFADTDFELALDDIELDLSELETDLAIEEPAPAVEAPPAPQPAAAPQMTAPVPAAAPVVAAAAAPAPAPAQDAGTMPFDLSQIASQDEPVTSMAALDVPELAHTDTPAETSYKPDYGIDVDSELASMFGGVTAAAAAPVASTAAVSTARTQAPRPVPTAQGDFKEFERTLHQDLGHSLGGAHAGAAQPRKIPLQNQTVENVTDPGSRRWLLAASVAAVVVIGAGVYFVFGGNPGTLIESGEPAVILADKDPIKVKPENPGGTSVPNQDKAVYDRVEGATETPTQESLISSDEEPVDVVQRTLLPQNAPDDGEAEEQFSGTPVGDTQDPRLLPSDAQADNADASDVEPVTITPRKVRTMIVRPDGTLVEKEVPADEAPSQAAPALADATDTGAAVPLSGSNETAAVDPAQVETSALAAPSGADAIADGTDNTATDVAEAEAESDENLPPVPTDTPVPSARPQPQSTTVASAEPAAAAAPAETQQPAPAQSSVPAGTYVVQVASLPSEAEAQKSYNNLSARYASIIGGRGVDIKQVSIDGRGTYYRVRIPAGTRDQAISMCESLKAAGGSCLVAR